MGEGGSSGKEWRRLEERLWPPHGGGGEGAWPHATPPVSSCGGTATPVMATVAAPWRVGNHPALGWFPTIHEEIVCCAVGNLELMLGRMMLASWQNFLVELWLGPPALVASCPSRRHRHHRHPRSSTVQLPSSATRPAAPPRPPPPPG
uniref:Uncharacterized protein n=1 Tax=Setaria viridis TaxID=4556 RepID=A0A4U6U6Z6_SETVI|nr:hypothetical protein SEVIR_6G193600v2 [Setaria viridis]